MKKFLSNIIFIGVFIILLATKSNGADTVNLDVTITEDYNYAYEVLEKVNEERAKVNANPLVMDQDLLDSAMVRAAELVFDFDHIRPNGTSCFTVNSKASGENIAIGQSSPASVMNSWMNSAGHKANILLSENISIGIGAVKYGNRYYWVQLFGRYNINQAPKVPQSNKTVTRNVDVLTSNIELYYNSTNNLYDVQYKDGFNPTIVMLNIGWEYACVTIDPKFLNYESSDNSVFTVEENGKINIVNPGKAILTVNLKENSQVTLNKEISIIGNIKSTNVIDIPNQVYKGIEVNPEVTIKNGEIILQNGVDYTLSYTNNNKTGKATITITGIGNYAGVTTKDFYIVPDKVMGLKKITQTKSSISVKWNQVVGADGYEISTNKAISNANTYNLKNLKAGTNYKIKVRAYVIINEKKEYGAYSNIITETTQTKDPIISKISISKKNAIVQWNGISGATGYEIYMSTSKKGTYKKIGTTNLKTYTKKNLAKGKTYYFKIRTYKTVNSKKVYSSYSKIKSIKVK